MNKKDKGFNFFKQGNSEKKVILFFTKYIKPNLFKIEIFFVIIIGLLFYLNLNSLLTVAGILFAQLYFFMAFSKYKFDNKTNSKVRIFFEYIINWGRSVSLIGILFVLTNWPEAELQLKIGVIILFTTLLGMLYFILKKSKDEIFSLNEFFRSLIIFIISFYYLIVGLS